MQRDNVRIAESADVDDRATIGAGSSVWHLAQVRESAVLGENCVIGRGAYIGTGVTVGNNCKVQNYALVYEPATLADGVFVGPAVVFTNDHFPRAVNPDGSLKSGHDWEPVGVTVLEGASVGANSTCVAPVTIGRWSLVAAGSVVVKDVPDFALVAGVPAKRIAWVGRAGVPLEPVEDTAQESLFRCPQSGALFRQSAPDQLTEVDQ
jgi:UDP-2-acetamido-3-amino-2,3-dideoxy-glucuronate N-acetyltransferase